MQMPSAQGGLNGQVGSDPLLSNFSNQQRQIQLGAGSVNFGAPPDDRFFGSAMGPSDAVRKRLIMDEMQVVEDTKKQIDTGRMSAVATEVSGSVRFVNSNTDTSFISLTDGSLQSWIRTTDRNQPGQSSYYNPSYGNPFNGDAGIGQRVDPSGQNSFIVASIAGQRAEFPATYDQKNQLIIDCSTPQNRDRLNAFIVNYNQVLQQRMQNANSNLATREQIQLDMYRDDARMKQIMAAAPQCVGLRLAEDKDCGIEKPLDFGQLPEAPEPASASGGPEPSLSVNPRSDLSPGATQPEPDVPRSTVTSPSFEPAAATEPSPSAEAASPNGEDVQP